ncbi:hypothetical protein KSF_103540 [Reticulibacter mediterranei]|uniref:Uncharacterized protein n=1 Tax=Reticulibacter mediterranei TaxID=2778369 RepID=A0A8J3J2C8_9CHLR|nr:hypothetical protein KSF_103540 [Reticulibacter mediterranei]
MSESSKNAWSSRRGERRLVCRTSVDWRSGEEEKIILQSFPGGDLVSTLFPSLNESARKIRALDKAVWRMVWKFPKIELGQSRIPHTLRYYHTPAAVGLTLMELIGVKLYVPRVRGASIW